MELFKQHKETENKVHENLYSNLALLSAFYPTTKEFDAIFRKDMFVKNNKGAFFEVVHYLLDILNSELTKQKLTSWPLLEIKMESKFRSELISYINELNQTYENADIPTCQASSLISPGGFRFVKFMLKISQLVLYKHLSQSEVVKPLHRLKPHNKNLSHVNKTQLSHLKKEIQLIEGETKELLKNFEKTYTKMDNKAKEITKSLTKINRNIQEDKRKLDKAQQDFNFKYPTYPSVTSLEEKLVILKSQVQEVIEFSEIFSSSEKLLHYIGDSNLTLEHNENDFTSLNEVSHIIMNKKELSLVEFFKGLSMLLEKKALVLQDPTNSCIEQTMQAINIQCSKYQMLLKQLDFQKYQMNNLLDELSVLFILKNDDTALALPLPL